MPALVTVKPASRGRHSVKSAYRGSHSVSPLGPSTAAGTREEINRPAEPSLNNPRLQLDGQLPEPPWSFCEAHH